MLLNFTTTLESLLLLSTDMALAYGRGVLTVMATKPNRRYSNLSSCESIIIMKMSLRRSCEIRYVRQMQERCKKDR